MTKDYGKKPAPSPKGGSSSKVLLVLVCFLLGYLSATMVDPSYIIDWLGSQISTHPLNHPLVVTKPKVAEVALPKPKFEFYTLLANDSSQTLSTPAPVVAARPEPSKVAPNPISKEQPLHDNKLASAIQSQEIKKGYLVQVGSFRSEQEAERIKASLTLRGFLVNVSIISQQQTRWYRVVIGPFASRDEAEKAQIAVARTEHVMGMIRKMDA